MNAESALLMQTIAIALLAGVLSQVLAERLAIPSIVPLLVAGVILGPDALGWIDPGSLGQGLEGLVGLSVAIILFEGGLHLRWEDLKAEGRAILQLVTLGALVTTLAASVTAWLLLPLEAETALLLGSLVMVTGPTVIGPLLKRVRIVRRVGFILESEGVLIDPIGAIASFVVLELLLPGERSWALGGWSVLARIEVGAAIGIASGLLLALALRSRRTGETELANLIVLAGVIATYVLANRVQSESGLAAAVACGVVIGNLTIPGRRELVDFKGILTTLVISLLFVLLAAGIRWDVLARAGVGGVVWVAGLMVLVRPLAVFVSTLGTEIPRSDKLLLAWISPRGIVAASVASLFAIYMREHGVEGGDLVQAMVFLTIMLTVVVQGLTAGLWARFLGLSAGSLGVVIVGADAMARLLGRLLRDLGREVVLIDSNARHCAQARREGLAAFAGNCLDIENLEQVGLRAADALVAVTPNSEVNYLACRLGLEEFRVRRALARINEDDESVNADTRRMHRIEHAFGAPLPEDFEERARRNPPLYAARVVAAAAAPLEALALEKGVPLICVRDGRAEVCGDLTEVSEGDRLLFLGEPQGASVDEVQRYPWDGKRA